MIVKLNRAITKKLVIRFNYSDRTKNREGTRILEPYLLGINEQGNLFVSGYFRATEEQVKDKAKSGHKNYLIDNIEEKSFTVSSEKFNSLKVEHPDKIYKTTKTIVLAVVYFLEIIIKTYLR